MYICYCHNGLMNSIMYDIYKFCETAENHMNVNFCDKNVVIAPIFRDSCYSRQPFNLFS